MTKASGRPVISVVIEGYNESREQGKADNTIKSLTRQDYPLHKVELILAGSSEQVNEWQRLCENPAPFAAVKAVAVDGGSYYDFKNMGAALADGDIVAFTDSDIYPAPTWISAIVESIQSGADVAVGLSLFKDADAWTGHSLLRQMAVCCTFGFILGPIHKGELTVRGFMDHNVAMRAEICRKSQYRTEFGRVIASPLLFRKLKLDGCRIRFNPNQRVTHFFEWAYWIRRLHFRYGFEIYRLRRLDAHYPNQWIRRFGPLEPVATMLWHMLIAVPRWFRFARMWGLGLPLACLCLPLFLCVAALAHGAEAAGMFATMVSPEGMRRYAESV